MTTTVSESAAGAALAAAGASSTGAAGAAAAGTAGNTLRDAHDATDRARSATATATATAPTTAASTTTTSTLALAADVRLLEEAMGAFLTAQSAMHAKYTDTQRRLEQDFLAVDEVSSTAKSQWTAYHRLVSMYEDLAAEFEVEGSARDDNNSAPAGSTSGATAASATAASATARTLALQSIEERLQLCKQQLNELRHAKPNSSSLFLHLMLGDVQTRIWRSSDRLRFKDAYNTFKQRATWVFLTFPLFQLFVYTCRLLFQMHLVWLIYYYCTVSLRENLLWVNGSSMKRWWIYHHYVSLFITAVMLLCPDPHIDDRRTQFFWFGVCQGVVMVCQNIYQAKRQYVRRTLGKARSLDVDTTETLVEKPTDLRWLLPMLAALYACELWFGVETVYAYVMATQGATSGVAASVAERVAASAAAAAVASGDLLHSSAYVARLPLLLIGVGFIVLAAGNALTTTQVLLQKNSMRRIALMLSAKKRGSTGSTDSAASSPTSVSVAGAGVGASVGASVIAKKKQ